MGAAWFNARNKTALALHHSGEERGLSALQSRLWNGWKKKGTSTLASLPFHSTEYAPGQTDIWVTLHSLKGVRQIPDPHFPPPCLSPAPSLTNCPFECQPSSLSNTSIVCQSVGRWQEEASKLGKLSSVNERVCVCFSDTLASCRISSLPF